MAQQSVFAIRDQFGRLIAASTPEIGEAVARWPSADSEPSYFRLSSFGPSARDYSGISTKLDSAAGPLSVTVAEAYGGDQLVHSILREFVFDTAWYVPPFVAVALLLAAFSVRRSLRPLRAASAQASAIGPESIALRLPETDVPTEALPLVIAVNRALDRLEQGFLIQRRFTANAAHELRTPLTIITTRLDTLEGNGHVSALRQEVARMNRLVEQLLCVARLYSVVLDASSPVDLLTWQASDRTSWRAKNTDTFKPMGPWIETDFDLDAAQTIVGVNGAEKIRFKTDSTIFGPAALISRMSQYLTLYPGDVVWMGTEGAPGDIKHGDTVDIEITGIHAQQPGGARVLG